MTTAARPPITEQYDSQPDYHQGRADAYDDSRTRTLDELVVHAGASADHATIPYALGYMDRVIELRMELSAVSAAEAELAYADKAVAR